MPMIVKQNGSVTEAVAASISSDNFEATLEMVPRNCTLHPAYETIPIPAFTVSGIDIRGDQAAYRRGEKNH
jgi:hypothetical protein